MMRPFVANRREIVERGMAPTRVVPALDELEYRHPRLDLGLEAAARQQFAFRGREEVSHIALSKQSPTEPIEGRTPASRQHAPNWIEVYWVLWSE